MDLALMKRFFSYVDIPNVDGCWQWIGNTDRHGYGRLFVEDKSRLAHRLSYEHFLGPMPSELVTDHLCRNRACVNPDHLEAVTSIENLKRGSAYRTHCPNGHEYTADNVRFRGEWARVCKICDRLRVKAYKARQRQGETA